VAGDLGFPVVMEVVGEQGDLGRKKRSGSLYAKYINDVWRVLAPLRTRGKLG
jgi:hypothetical protein